MNETLCTNPGTRGDQLMAYLYDEAPPEDRLAFDRHLITCAACRLELDGLGGVRAALEQWAPPDPVFGVTVPTSPPAVVRQKGVWASMQHLPAWAQVAAAMLFLGVAAGLANLDVSSSSDGFTIRTGWMRPEAVPNRASSSPSVGIQTPAPAAVPWGADLATLRQELRAALDARPSAVATTPAPDDVVLRRVKALLQESEQRQQSELALRVAEMSRDAQTQRQADLVRIDRSLGLIQSRTGMEVMRTQQQVNSLAQRVSQKP